MRAPALPERAAAWQLRAAWAARREVVLSLDRGGPLRGWVEHVATTSAYALVWDGAGAVHVPCALVRDVRRPHFHEPAHGGPVAPPPRRLAVALPPVHPGQLALPVGEGSRPGWWRDRACAAS